MRRTSTRISRPLLIAVYANAAGLLSIGAALWSRSNAKFPDFASSAMAQQQLPIGGGAGVFIVPAQFSANLYGCYIMDVDAQTVAAYMFQQSDKRLNLMASRSFKYDRRVQNYNTSPPPLEIRDLIEKESTDLRGADQKKTPDEPEKKPQ